jgi:pyochelin synthetase
MANYDLELFWRTPMTATELLADLAQQGVQLWVEGDRLRYRAPKGALTPSLRDGLLAHKSELLALLPPPQPETAPDPFASFPLTDLQQAYALGQGEFFELGRVAAHYYTELEVVDVDVDRLNRAWQRLVERHLLIPTLVIHILFYRRLQDD